MLLIGSQLRDRVFDECGQFIKRQKTIRRQAIRLGRCVKCLQNRLRKSTVVVELDAFFIRQ